MKAKIVIALSALLIAPFMSQAEWINTDHWPWIYSDEDNWEYAYTPSFWTCNIGTGEYCLRGVENSVLAPESLENIALYDLIHEPESGLLYWFGDAHGSDGLIAGIKVFRYGRSDGYPIDMQYSYRVTGPNKAQVLIACHIQSEIETIDLLELSFSSQGEGECNIVTLRSPYGQGRLRSFQFQLNDVWPWSPAEPVDVIKEFAEGSVAKHCSDQIDNRLMGKDRNIAKNIYSSFPSNSDYTDAVETRGEVDEFIRNPNFWAADVDLSCISPSYIKAGQTTHRRWPTGTLISPQHWISCSHSGFYPKTGDTLCFVSMDGTLYTPLIVGVKQSYPLEDSYIVDTTIGILDSPLPQSVVPAKFFPVDWTPYIPYQVDIPALLLDHQEHGMVGNLRNVSNHRVIQFGRGFTTNLDPVKWPKRAEFVDIPYEPGPERDNRIPGWSTNIEQYDSGNPSFLIINGELVLLSTWTSILSGPGHTENRHAIQEIMDELSTLHSKPHYTLTEVDLSGFPTY